MGRIVEFIGGSYECKYDWKDNCFVQCGDEGVVLDKADSYLTAFFEAFPKEPKTFIRGEGKTIAEAEKQAWETLEKYTSCSNHEFERRGYENGVGFCKHCNLFNSNAFEPLNKCTICNTPTHYMKALDGNCYCREHEDCVPDELLTDWQLEIRERKRREQLYTEMDIQKYVTDEGIKDIMLSLFKNEGLENISDIGRDFFSNSRILQLRPLIKRHEFVTYEVYNDMIYLILNEVNAETTEKTGRYIKVFSSNQSFLQSVVEFYENKRAN